MDVLHLLAHHAQGVDEGSGDDDGRAMLVVVEDGDVQLTLQRLLDLEALGAFDVFEVDAAEGGGDGLAGRDDAGRVVGVDADGESIHAAELLEQHSLALHDRQACLWADVTQTQHGGAVGDDSHHIALEGVLVDVVGIFPDLAAGFSDTGRVSCLYLGILNVLLPVIKLYLMYRLVLISFPSQLRLRSYLRTSGQSL